MARNGRRQLLRIVALSATLGVAVAALPVDAALIPAVNLPPVCGYLGVVNGTRQIDPGFAAGERPASPPSATPAFPSGAVLLGNTTQASATSAATSGAATTSVAGSAYCHTLPPLQPIVATGG
jgi:type IV secretory pathway TrbL component